MQASTPYQQPQILNLYTGPIIWSATRLSNSWKTCHYGERGHWQSQNHACVTWWFVSTLCMKVSFEPDTGTWIFSTRFGGPGCSVLRPEQGLSAARIPVPHWRNSTPPQLDAAQVSHLMTCWNCCCLHATFLIPQHMATVQNLLITARSPSWDTCAFALHTLYQCPQIKHCKSFMRQVDVFDSSKRNVANSKTTWDILCYFIVCI